MTTKTARTRKPAAKKSPFSGAALLDAISAAAPAPEPVSPTSTKVVSSWAKIAGTDADFRIVAVREFAQAHFEEGGWDIVSEAYDTAAIYEVVKKVRTADGAVKRMADHIGAIADYRADIVGA